MKGPRGSSSYPPCMRIIAGEFKSRRLSTPPDGEVTRPIPDRVKESLFNLLRGHFEGATVFDGFSGTGSIGLEAISRGASRCVMVEKDKGTAAVLKRNVDALDCHDRAEVVIGDCLGMGALARAPRPLKLAFLDPPYPLVRDPLGFRRVMAQMAALVGILTDDGFAVLRLPHPLDLEVPVEAPAEPARPTKRRPKDFKRPKPRDDSEDDAAEDGEGPAPAAKSKPEVVRTRVTDLGIEGAVGPETHLFQTMALHLYMKKR